MKLSIFFTKKVLRDKVKPVLFVGGLLGLALFVLFESWIHFPMSIALCLILGLIAARPFFGIIFIILIAPITRFPGLVSYMVSIKYLLLSSTLFIWLLYKFYKSSKTSWDYLKQIPFHPFVLLFSGLLLLSWCLFDKTNYNTQLLINHLLVFAYFYFFLDIFYEQRNKISKFIFFIQLMTVFIGGIAILQYLIAQFHLFPQLTRWVIPGSERIAVVAEKYISLAALNYRSSGTFYHPNLLGIYMAMLFPINLSLTINAETIKKKWLGAFISLVSFLAIICSGSRGAFLNIFVSSLFLIVIYRKKISPIFYIASTLGILSICAFNTAAVIGFMRLEGGISSAREIIWSGTWQLWMENFFLGWGLGHFPLLYLNRFGFPTEHDMELALNDIIFTGNDNFLINFHAHNAFLNYAVELGVLALILLCYFYYLVFSKIQFQPKGNKLSHFVCAACVASIIGNLCHSLFEATTNFYNLSMGLMFVLIVALAYTCSQNIKQETPVYVRSFIPR